QLWPNNILVNAISAGPIKTLAAAGIGGFSAILQVYRDRAPLRRTVDTSEVAGAAMFLLSDAGRAVTAEVLMVDGGYDATGMYRHARHPAPGLRAASACRRFHDQHEGQGRTARRSAARRASPRHLHVER